MTIALLTDFGTEDGYPAAMKGRILSLAPQARIVDISHQIEPYNIKQGAFALLNSYRHFPAQTIFIAAVDPGVGTKRKCLAVKTALFWFIGPDNGIFSFIYQLETCEVYSISTQKLPHKISPTFHARDVFAPIAAKLSIQENIAPLLSPIKRVFSFLSVPKKVGDNQYLLEVIHVDHFGNLILNFHQGDLKQKPRTNGLLSVEIGKCVLKGPLLTFGSVESGELVLTWDSSNYLQIAQNTGSAQKRLSLGVGDTLLLRL